MKLPDFNLGGRVALLTGAGRGIGLAIANAFAAAGAAVAIQDIDLDVARKAADEINAAGGKAIALGGDITDLESVRGLIPQTVQALNGLHILVNNASIQSWTRWTEIEPEILAKTYAANVTHAIVLAQQAVPIFEQQRWGRVLNIGSIQGEKGNGGMAHYAMTKAALKNFTSGAARGLGKFNITINCLAPGWIHSLRNADPNKSPEQWEQDGKRIPIPRIGVPEDLAGTALLLCSDAGSYVTGQTWLVDGGLSL